MSIQHERRVSKLEQSSPKKSLPVIRLIRSETETIADAFKKSGHSGMIEDFHVICRVIVDPPSPESGDFFKREMLPEMRRRSTKPVNVQQYSGKYSWMS